MSLKTTDRRESLPIFLRTAAVLLALLVAPATSAKDAAGSVTVRTDGGLRTFIFGQGPSPDVWTLEGADTVTLAFGAPPGWEIISVTPPGNWEGRGNGTPQTTYERIIDLDEAGEVGPEHFTGQIRRIAGGGKGGGGAAGPEIKDWRVDVVLRIMDLREGYTVTPDRNPPGTLKREAAPPDEVAVNGGTLQYSYSFLTKNVGHGLWQNKPSVLDAQGRPIPSNMNGEELGFCLQHAYIIQNYAPTIQLGHGVLTAYNQVVPYVDRGVKNDSSPVLITRPKIIPLSDEKKYAAGTIFFPSLTYPTLTKPDGWTQERWQGDLLPLAYPDADGRPAGLDPEQPWTEAQLADVLDKATKAVNQLVDLDWDRIKNGDTVNGQRQPGLMAHELEHRYIWNFYAQNLLDTFNAARSRGWGKGPTADDLSQADRFAQYGWSQWLNDIGYGRIHSQKMSDMETRLDEVTHHVALDNWTRAQEVQPLPFLRSFSSSSAGVRP